MFAWWNNLTGIQWWIMNTFLNNPKSVRRVCLSKILFSKDEKWKRTFFFTKIFESINEVWRLAFYFWSWIDEFTLNPFFLNIRGCVSPQLSCLGQSQHTHSRPENLKKSRPKKLVKSNIINVMNFFDQIPFFAISKMAKYQFLNWEKV